MLQGALKTKFDIHSSMDMEALPKTTSKQTYRKYEMLNSFLTLKRKLASMSDQKFSILNAARKYFGTKITWLSNSSLQGQANSVRNSFRYFRDVNFEETVFLIDRRFRVRSTSTTATIKTIGKIGILNQSIQVSMTSVRRILSVCRCKISISLSDEYQNAKWWLSMPIHIKNKIKHLKIAFSKTNHLQLLEYINLFKNFNTTESYTIRILDDDYSRWNMQQPSPLHVGFMFVLCRIKTLKSLELDLFGISISREMLTLVLNQISKNDPYRWHLKVLLKHNRYDKNYPIEIGEVKSILNKLDFLSLKASNTDVRGYEYNDTHDLLNMKHLTDKRKRILDIEFPENSVRQLNLKDLLDNCTSLKGIHIRSFGSCFEIKRSNGGEQFATEKKWLMMKSRSDSKEEDGYDDYEENEKHIKSEERKEEVERLIQSMTWASNIEDAVLSFNENENYDDNDFPYWILLSVFENQSQNLRLLELYYCASSVGYAYDQRREENIELRRRDVIIMSADGLEGFVSLEELKLTSDGSDIHTLKPVLQHLTNLI